MEIVAILLVIFIFLIAIPYAQKRRERALAERLKKTRNPIEAGLIVDDAIRTTQEEGDFFARLRQSYWFWLR